MPLTDRAKTELERRGSANVILLLFGHGVDHGLTSTVKLGLGGDHPSAARSKNGWRKRSGKKEGGRSG
jgi:hypothetical protein